MATFAEELVDFLDTAGAGTKGTDLFYNKLPDLSSANTTVSAVAVHPGPPSPTRKPWVNSTVQVLTRGVDYDAAVIAASEIYGNWHSVFDYALTNNQVVSSIGQGGPASIGQDSLGRHLVSANYEFITYDTTGGGASGGASSGTGGKTTADPES